MADIVYPARCPVCDRIVIPRGVAVCGECADAFVPIRGAYCLKCGKPLAKADKSTCDDCSVREHVFDECRSAFVYDDNMRKCIYRFKYNGRSEYAAYLGRKMAEELSEVIDTWHADALIPVPMHKSKEKRRGYNQAELLANAMSYHLKIPVKSGVVARNKSTKIMRLLSAKERENNLKKAFKIVGDSVKLTNVIIIDDIYTTGSTADAVAGVLKSAGVRRVFVASLSTGCIKS